MLQAAKKEFRGADEGVISVLIQPEVLYLCISHLRRKLVSELVQKEKIVSLPNMAV